MRRKTPTLGTIRTRRYIAWVPRVIGDTWIWLEWYSVDERFERFWKWEDPSWKPVKVYLDDAEDVRRGGS